MADTTLSSIGAGALDSMSCTLWGASPQCTVIAEGRVHPDAGRVGAPGRLVEVLGHAVGVLGRSALRGGVTLAGDRARHMQQDQPQGPPGGRVGDVARAERAEPRVVAGGSGDLSVHHQ